MTKTLTDPELLELYRQMALIRRFEEKSAELYAEGKIGGFLHLYIGEEAIAVGSCKALLPTDHLLTAYRDHGWAIARGLSAKRVMAELLGKATGVSGGKGGSMHLASAEHRYWGGHAIVGGHLPLATGVGLEIRYNNKPDAVLCVLGEGTTNIGYFHESLNLAALWKLPVIFLVENNQYGMGTEVGRASALTNIYEKGCAYGIENQQFNGQDVIETYEVMARALDYARQEGPVLLEAITYRYVGHSMGDPERYRTKAEIEMWRERDPLCRIEDKMTAEGAATFDDFTRIQAEVAAEVDEIVKYAEESPEPDDAALWEHIFVESDAGMGGRL
ncbi:MAG: pyruvate dehydrogenase (acetyl-transferring) E1 component subunit alpha [Anaerolineae bacterium]|nr:pyruvate dehydrogenase (acetyl-transferring) E1 component subunit alpha [Anaerolineae bacterium]